MPTRRTFLYLAGVALPGLAVRPFPLHRPVLPLALFFDEEHLPALQARYAGDPLFAGLRARLDALDREGQRRFLRETVRYNDHLYHLKQVSDLARETAFLYAMTGDGDAAALAAEAVRTIMKFPRWDYFLEGGTRVFGLQRAPGAVLAVALAADWLGDVVTETERTDWLRTMAERGLEACFLALYGMRHPDRVVGWTMDPTSTYFEHRPDDRIDLTHWPRILDRTNLKAVPAAALAVGAVAHRLHFGPGDDADRWLEQALFSLRSFGDLFARDGTYDENISYANYTTTHLVQAFEVLRRRMGIDLYDVINWPGFVDFILAMSLPTHADPHGIVNFGDAGEGMISAVPFRIARQAGDRRAQWFGRTLARDHDEWSVLWYEASLPAEAPPADPCLWHSDLDWIVARTGYRADDLVVAMRSGGPSNHEHADRNSLIVKCFGEVLVADPYRPPYSFSDPAWMLRTTAGHSALLIDGQGHQYHDGSEGTNASDAVARIVRRGERSGYFFWTSDATAAYGLVDADVRSVTRTVVVLYALPAVLVFDKVLKDATPSHVQARFFGDNRDGATRLEAGVGGFRTRRPQARLHAFALAPGGVDVHIGRLPVPEETAARHPFAEVGTREARLDPFLLTVLLPVRDRRPDPAATLQATGAGVYTVEIEQGGRRVRCRVTDAGTIPEFEVTG